MTQNIMLLDMFAHGDLNACNDNLAQALNTQNITTARLKIIGDNAAIVEEQAYDLLAQGRSQDLVESVNAYAENLPAADLTVIEAASMPSCWIAHAERINMQIAHDFNACVVAIFNAMGCDRNAIVNAILQRFSALAADGLTVKYIAIVNLTDGSKASDFDTPNFKCIGVSDANLDALSLDLKPLIASDFEGSSQYLTPNRFMRSLRQKAHDDPRRIVCPEGDLDRILKATEVLVSQRLAKIILLGSREAIEASAQKCGAIIDDSVEIVDPKTDARIEDYAQQLYELRKHKGMTIEKARETITDRTYFGTMMVYKGDADGLVSGATTTTAATLRPALQFIKTKPGIKTVSGAFLMCLHDRVLVYADCAVMPSPNADQLADIAHASARTARSLGLTPRVAMLSYSSGSSGSGPMVDAVAEATKAAQSREAKVAIEGPIQYDAAISPVVAATKMPNSEVAGKANVFVFPDLNAGNIAYKAVQRASGAIAIGPVLQGMRLPVNDLSRGATVDDIVNTVVLTVIQAQDVD